VAALGFEAYLERNFSADERYKVSNYIYYIVKLRLSIFLIIDIMLF